MASVSDWAFDALCRAVCAVVPDVVCRAACAVEPNAVCLAVLVFIPVLEEFPASAEFAADAELACAVMWELVCADILPVFAFSM